MTPETKNAINGVARSVLNEFASKSNELTYRQLLDKHAVKISPLIPVRHRSLAWMWLNCVCQRLAMSKQPHPINLYRALREELLCLI